MYMQEVIQLAYEALKRVFEDKRHGISSAHKYHYNFMKGVAQYVCTYLISCCTVSQVHGLQYIHTYVPAILQHIYSKFSIHCALLFALVVACPSFINAKTTIVMHHVNLHSIPMKLKQ